MNRLIENTVFSGFVTAWRLATWPTRISPSLVKATTEGVRRLPSWFEMTTGLPPSITATTELVVPRSMPITLPMAYHLLSGSGLDRNAPRPGPTGRLREPDGQHTPRDACFSPVEVEPRGQRNRPHEAPVARLENAILLPRVFLLLALLPADRQARGREPEVEIVTVEPGDLDRHDQLVVGLACVDGRQPPELADRREPRRLLGEPLQPAVQVVAEREGPGARRLLLALTPPRQERSNLVDDAHDVPPGYSVRT